MSDELTILIADDEPATAELIRKIVVSHWPHVEVSIVYSGQDCLDSLGANAPDILILDYIMPEINGMNVLEWLQLNQQEVPVVFVTAYGNEAVAAQALQLGARAYVHKTDLVHVLGAVLDKVLEHQKLVQQNQRLKAELVEIGDSSTAQLAIENRLAQIVHSRHDIRLRFKELRDEILSLIPVDWMSLGLVTPDGAAYRIHAVSQPYVKDGTANAEGTFFCREGVDLPLDQISIADEGPYGHENIVTSVIMGSEPYINNSVDGADGHLEENSIPPLDKTLRRQGIRSYAAFPFVDPSDSGKAFGSLNLASRESGFFTDPRINLLSALSVHIALSLSNQRRASMDGVSQTVYTLQHVVNNALAAIVGNAEMIGLSDSAEIPQRINTIVDSSMRISGCLEQLRMIKDPLMQRTTLGGMEFLDVQNYLTGKP